MTSTACSPTLWGAFKVILITYRVKYSLALTALSHSVLLSSLLNVQTAFAFLIQATALWMRMVVQIWRGVGSIHLTLALGLETSIGMCLVEMAHVCLRVSIVSHLWTVNWFHQNLSSDALLTVLVWKILLNAKSETKTTESKDVQLTCHSSVLQGSARLIQVSASRIQTVVLWKRQLSACLAECVFKS